MSRLGEGHPLTCSKCGGSTGTLKKAEDKKSYYHIRAVDCARHALFSQRRKKSNAIPRV